jgi:uncharacterized protein DUF3263
MQHRRTPALSDRDLKLLEIEREWGATAAASRVKIAQAQAQLGLSQSAYALLINALLNDPAAEEEDPETIHRLRAVREMHRTLQVDDGPMVP